MRPKRLTRVATVVSVVTAVPTAVMVALVALVAAIAPAAGAADLPLHPYLYTEGFEADPPDVSLWASRGTPPTVATLAPSTEQAFEGTHSLKVDVTFGDSTYYYFGVPLRLLVAGELHISARLLVAAGNENNVGFGVNVAFPPTQHTGCSSIDSYREPEGEWKLIEADLVAYGRNAADTVMSQYVSGVTGGEVGVMLDRWSLFLTGEPGKRVVAYLDDIRIEGNVPDEEAYLDEVKAEFDASRARFQEQVAAWRQELADAQPSVAAAPEHEAEAPRLVAAVAEANRRAGELLDQFERDAYASPGDVAGLQRGLAVLRNWPRALEAISAAADEGRAFLVAPCNRATMADRRGADALAGVISEDTGLQCAACAGEYESVSAVVYGLQDVPGVVVECQDLRGPAGTLPGSIVDVRLVKSWYQGASNNIGYTKDKWLVPELLLKDDALVRVDTEGQANYLRSTAEDGTETYLLCSGEDSTDLDGVRPVDSAALRPFDVPAGESRELWLTLRVPDDAAPGVYGGALRLTSAEGTASLGMRLTVHPFALEASRLIYSIYYRGTLSPDGAPTISSEGKSEEQYRAEIEDMRAHGVLYPTNYQGRGDQLARVLDIRRECGLPTEAFYNLGLCVGPQTEDQLAGLADDVRWWRDLLATYGYGEAYFYGIDEATGETLARQKAAWRATQEAGGKTFVACYKDTFEAMGDLLDVAVLAGAPDPAEAAKYHGVGSLAFCYANPQVGVEDPAIYRRNFGLVLLKAGFDGAMDYAYQHSFHHIWDDFDDTAYRDHNFTYPTMTGVIPTIQWEGFREGVDDVRYATTLEKAIAEAPAERRADADAARAWLDALDPATADLDDARAGMASWIERLR
jgi:hypothetical protein